MIDKGVLTVRSQAFRRLKHPVHQCCVKSPERNHREPYRHGSGPEHRAIHIAGFARVFRGNVVGDNSSLGRYFMVLRGDTNPAFHAPDNLTYTASICFLEAPDGATSHQPGFGRGAISALWTMPNRPVRPVIFG